MKIKLLIITIAFSFFLGVTNSYGFCVYNVTDTQIRVIQTSGGYPYVKIIDDGFAVTLIPRTSACCSWKEKRCNAKGKKDSLVELTVYKYKGASQPDKVVAKLICKVKIKASGSLTVKGMFDNYKCESHDN